MIVQNSYPDKRLQVNSDVGIAFTNLLDLHLNFEITPRFKQRGFPVKKATKGE